MSNIALASRETIKPWQVMAAGMAAMLLTVGIARFAYTPMLPLMQAQTGMSPFVGGLLATVNYAGYMTGALLASTISDARRRYLVYRIGLVASVIGTAGMGLTSETWVWLVLRYIAGVGGASGMLLPRAWFSPFWCATGGDQSWGCISSASPSALFFPARW